MAEQSTMIAIGASAPEFELPDVVSGQTYRLDSFSAQPILLVAFLCRHCPYVVHVKEEIARLADDYQPRGVAVVGISSNDASAYPDDAPDSLREFAVQENWHFPLLYDESQAV